MAVIRLYVTIKISIIVFTSGKARSRSLFILKLKIMKQITFLTIFSIIGLAATAQNYIGAPVGLYGPAYNGSTLIGDGGNVLVEGNGNWYFGGPVVSADKGGQNAPNATGRSEIMIFDGSGTYDNAATINGATGFFIDGYAGAINKTASFILPLGEGTIAHPLTIMSGASGNVAYFSGLGTKQNTTLSGTAAEVFSPYFDFSGINTGDYIFGFETGFGNSSDLHLLESGNSSVNGTSGTTSYNEVPSTISYDNTTGVLNATITSTYGATQLYVGSTSSALPVGLHGFAASFANKTVSLVWKTSFESNNRGFDVQRSQDGVHYNSIGFVPSLAASSGGNSSLELDYAYVDNTLLTAGTYYYRLIQQDNNNKQTISRTVNIEVNGLASTIKVYPNPTSGKFWVVGLKAGSRIEVFNTAGQKVKSVVTNSDQTAIDLNGYAQGVYYLKFVDNKGVIGGSNLLIK